MVLCIKVKHLFGLVCLKDIVLEVSWLFQMQLSQTKPCCHGLFRIKRHSPDSPFKQSIPLLCSSNCTDLNFNN